MKKKTLLTLIELLVARNKDLENALALLRKSIVFKDESTNGTFEPDKQGGWIYKPTSTGGTTATYTPQAGFQYGGALSPDEVRQAMDQMRLDTVATLMPKQALADADQVARQAYAQREALLQLPYVELDSERLHQAIKETAMEAAQQAQEQID